MKQLTIREAKEKALQLKSTLLDKKSKTTLTRKQVKEIVKLIDSFVRCHCSNDAVFTKYALLKAKLSEVSECLI